MLVMPQFFLADPTYESTNNLLSTLGLISALLLAVVFSLPGTVGRDELIAADALYGFPDKTNPAAVPSLVHWWGSTDMSPSYKFGQNISISAWFLTVVGGQRRQRNLCAHAGCVGAPWTPKRIFTVSRPAMLVVPLLCACEPPNGLQERKPARLEACGSWFMRHHYDDVDQQSAACNATAQLLCVHAVAVQAVSTSSPTRASALSRPSRAPLARCATAHGGAVQAHPGLAG